MLVHTLPPAAWQLLRRLGQEPWLREFYLAGGSAAALHLGHRVSIDLDFFTPQDSDPELLSRQLQRVGLLRVQQQSRGTLVGQLSGVQVSYFTYPYYYNETSGHGHLPLLLRGVLAPSGMS